MNQSRRRHLLFAAGSLLAAPLVRAQQPQKMYRLGFLTPVASPIFPDAFKAAMRERGWIEGRDFALETRVTRDPARAVELAKELVALRVDLIITLPTTNALAARKATRTIPIIMFTSGYPVEVGLAASYARPGGNVTGLSTYAGTEIWGKYVQFLSELRPGLRELGVLSDYAPPIWSEKESEPLLAEFRRAARSNGINLHFWMVRSEKELTDALSAAARGPIEALFITAGGGIHNQPASRARIADLVLQRRLPAMTDFAGVTFAATQCVLAYAVPISELANRTAGFADRILRGAKPGDLPIELPSKFELVVNLKTARQIGLTIPQSILLRADRVIA